MRRIFAVLTAIIMIALGMVTFSGTAATAAKKTCETSVPTTEVVHHPEVSHVVHHDSIVVTEWLYVKYTHTKTKTRYGDWSEYGPWERWEPTSHISWENFNVEGLGEPAYHGSGEVNGVKWYREWQARNTGETRYRVIEQGWDETIIDSEAWDETITTPGSRSCTAQARTNVHVTDKCNCYRDKVTMTGGPHVKIKSSHPGKTTWVFKVTGKKVGDTQYLLPSKIGGNSGWAVTQTYKVHTKNQVCPCKKNHNCHQLYPNYTPPADHCRGGKCN